jgi:hypothetical protein
MNRRTITAAFAVAAAAAVPVQGAAAKPHGHGGPPEGKGRCAKAQSVGFAAGGSLAGYTADSVTLTIAHANKHARGYIASAGSTFPLADARLRFRGVTDADGSGAVDFADVLPTDVVRVIGKVSRPKRGCPAGDAALTVRKVQVVRPDAAETEQPEEHEQD